jgi:hypothetical protein
MENFIQGQQIIFTPCNHGFHADCILNWVETQSIAVEKDKAKRVNLSNHLPDERPDCPNCGQSISKRAEVVEKSAMDQIDKILQSSEALMMSSIMESDMDLHSDGAAAIDANSIEINVPGA